MNPKHRRRLLGVLALGALSAPAAAQNLLTNPGFEEVNPANSNEALGWHRCCGVTFRRTMDDGNGPAFIRTGDASIEIRGSGAGGFTGMTTNIFNPDTLTLYDPPYTWGGGDALVSGFYLIPADQPITGDRAGIKLEFRRGHTVMDTNFSVCQAFDGPGITGHTDGEWVYFEHRVTQADLLGCEEHPPLPVGVSVLPFRFSPDGTTTSGTIFWDDLCFSQGEPACEPPVACPCDWNGVDGLDSQDYFDFLEAFFNGDADYNGDTVTDSQDFFDFLNCFFEPPEDCAA